jgi:hypothetical protein
MAVTRAQKSSLTTAAKFNDAGAGNFNYPWADGEQGSMTSDITLGPSGSSTTLSTTAVDGFSFIEADNGKLQGLSSWGGPGQQQATYDGGRTLVQSPASLSYGTYATGFNGAFLGGGNYMTSSAGFTNNLERGWTYITGYNGVSASFGFGSGGWTTDNVPVYLIPYTQSGSFSLLNFAGAVGSKGISSATWNTRGVATAAGNGYQARTALTNNVVAYAYHTNTTPAAGNLTISYAPVTASTGAIGGFSVASISGVTGTLTSLVAVNGTFVLSTSSNQIFTSTNGATWTARTSPYSGSAALYLTRETSGRIMAAPPTLGSFPYVYNSADGINWTASATNLSPTSTVTAIATGPGIRAMFLLASGPGQLAYRNNNSKYGI